MIDDMAAETGPATRRLSTPALVAIVLAAFSTWAFVEIAEEMVEGDSLAIDRGVMHVLGAASAAGGPPGPAWLVSAARDLTALGSTAVLGLVVVAASLFLLLSGRGRDALYVVLATGGGALASLALKAAFRRPRPDLISHGDLVLTASFPSGHAMLSAIVYLTLGAMLARIVAGGWQRVFVVGVALTLTGLVGLTRIYLGVHWPTDVAAGWAAGAAWAVGCWGMLELRRSAAT